MQRSGSKAGAGCQPSSSGDPVGRSWAPWLALSAVLGAVYLVFLDRTTLGIALTHIALDLDVRGGSLDVDWVVTAFLVASGVTLPIAGWIAESRGQKRVYLETLAVFVVGSIVSGLAPNLVVLLGGRVLQGLAAGIMMPLSLAIAYTVFPPERRGTALGIWGVAAMAAPAIGPPLGGWLITVASWRWIFLINLPIGMAAALVARRHLPRTEPDGRKALQWTIWMAAGLGMIALIVASRQLLVWGVTSPRTILVLAVGMGGLAWAVRGSLRVPEPLIELRMFAVRTFVASMAVLSLKRVGQLARFIFLPVALQSIYGFDAIEVGAMFTAEAAGMMLTMALGGWLADRIGSRMLVASGLSVVAGVMWMLGHLDAATPRSEIVMLLWVGGMANGITIMPNSVAGMNSVPTRLAPQAAAVRSIVREIAAAVGVASLAALVVARVGTISPEIPGSEAADVYNLVFRIAAVTSLVAAAVATQLPGRSKMRELQRMRSRTDERFFPGGSA